MRWVGKRLDAFAVALTKPHNVVALWCTAALFSVCAHTVIILYASNGKAAYALGSWLAQLWP